MSRNWEKENKLYSDLMNNWGVVENGDRSTLYLDRHSLETFFSAGCIRKDKEHNCKVLKLFNKFYFFVYEYKTEEEAIKSGNAYRKKDKYYYSIPSDTLILISE